MKTQNMSFTGFRFPMKSTRSFPPMKAYGRRQYARNFEIRFSLGCLLASCNEMNVDQRNSSSKGRGALKIRKFF